MLVDLISLNGVSSPLGLSLLIALTLPLYLCYERLHARVRDAVQLKANPDRVSQEVALQLFRSFAAALFLLALATLSAKSNYLALSYIFTLGAVLRLVSVAHFMRFIDTLPKPK